MPANSPEFQAIAVKDLTWASGSTFPDYPYHSLCRIFARICSHNLRKKGTCVHSTQNRKDCVEETLIIALGFNAKWDRHCPTPALF